MVSDLRQRVPGHSLIDELLHQWDVGAIHLGETPNDVIIDAEAVSWYRGVIGERRVAALLGQLGDEWTVLHSVPVGSGTTDIDHIVIGPPGVFTINTKYSPGKEVWVAGTNLRVDGRAQRHVQNSIREVIRAAGALAVATGLDVPVSGVIAFVDPARITIRFAPGDDDHVIQVVSDRGLIGALYGTTMLLPNELDRIVDAAVRPETWHQAPSASTIGNHIEQEFVALEQAVGPQLAAPVVRSLKATKTPRPIRRRGRAAASTRPSRSRRKTSTLEGLLVAAVLVGLGFFLTRPEGQALVSSIFTR
jgi:catechol 2,3-dioxygenase-like lactoylglutathione lyase family enzyme